MFTRIVSWTIGQRNKGVQIMNRLKKFRKERGLSQLRLAYLTGINPPDISRIENGWLKPYPGWRKRLARALGCKEKELFPGEEQDGNAK